MSLPMNKLKSINTKNMSDEEWKQLRTHSIGGSDCGTILGMNNYQSPFTLWQKKLCADNYEEDISDKIQVKFGHYNEQFVAKLFEEKTGKKLRKHNKMMYHKDYDFISANVDRVVIGENALLECKTTSEFLKDKWKDGNVPESYMAQCYHYMAVTGVDVVYIAVLFGNSEFHYETIERDEEVINDIINAEVEFWNEYIVKGQRPPADDSEITSKALNNFWKETKNDVVNFDEEKTALFKGILAIKEQQKELDKQLKGHQNQLKELLGENEFGEVSEYKASWKKQNRESFDAKRFKEENPELYEQYKKSSTTRTLNVKKLKVSNG
ncbi:YqaJ viral recombinase family nuclease [Staphylococcus equorum]|uniref:YqaJ viral recombinase family nuclease n=1 Tax=Staphylococcus equorum TaxID=246432 RepID=UPI002557B902|nr:YqaJ viral recombinase family protein [Staphylococcus equorum]MDK9867840.1 YqaJ viral recombinase family protein [Staphylococcus equorum]